MKKAGHDLQANHLLTNPLHVDIFPQIMKKIPKRSARFGVKQVRG